jgi:hypothetical protein
VTHGTLALTSPWSRRPFRDPEVRRATEARIPAGYTVSIYCNSDGSAYGVKVLRLGTPNRVVWGDDGARHYYTDVHAGIADALAWIEWNQTTAA